MSEKTTLPAESRSGWVMVVVSFLLIGTVSGVMNSISVFLIPLSEDFGWLRGETAFALMAGLLAMGVCGIGMGWLFTRYPARLIVLTGTAVLGLALFLLSRQQSLRQFYLLYILMGGIGYGALWSPLLANLGEWFERHRGLALGIVTGGQQLGGGVVPYLAGFLIAAGGWREAYGYMGYFTLGVLLPLALLVRNSPKRGHAALSPAPGGTGREASPRKFHGWALVDWLGTAIFVDRFVNGVALVHLVPLARDRGISMQEAASILIYFSTAGFLARIFFGKLSDIIGGLRSWMLAVSGISSLVFWLTQVETLWAYYILATLMGLFNASATTCIICVNERVPVRERPVSIAVVSLCGFGGMGVGAWAGGFLFDLTGSYTLSFASAAFAGLAGLALLAGFYLSTQNFPDRATHAS